MQTHRVAPVHTVMLSMALTILVWIAPAAQAQPFVKVNLGAPTSDVHNSGGASWVDYDGDGDLDLFVTNFRQADALYRNDGGAFTFVANSELVRSRAPSLGQSWADLDNDGDLDVCVAGNPTRLFQNTGNGAFVALTGASLANIQGFSCAWGDYDGDGLVDLFVAMPAGFYGGPARPNTALHNEGGGAFSRKGSQPFTRGTSSYTIPTWSDFDQDGDLDLYVANMGQFEGPSGEANVLYRNDQANGRHWLKLDVAGTASNRAAIGAKVWVTATIAGQRVTQLREVSAQNTLNGHNSLTVHFGLGDAQRVEELKVQLPSGATEVLADVPADQTLRLVEEAATALVAPQDNGRLGALALVAVIFIATALRRSKGGDIHLNVR